MNKLIATLVAATFAMGTAFAQTATSSVTTAVKATPPAMPTAVAAPVSVTPVKAAPAIAATTTVTPVAPATAKTVAATATPSPATAPVVAAKAEVPVTTKHAKLHTKKVTHKATEKQPVVVAAAKPATVTK